MFGKKISTKILLQGNSERAPRIRATELLFQHGHAFWGSLSVKRKHPDATAPRAVQKVNNIKLLSTPDCGHHALHYRPRHRLPLLFNHVRLLRAVYPRLRACVCVHSRVGWVGLCFYSSVRVCYGRLLHGVQRAASRTPRCGQSRTHPDVARLSILAR